MKKVYFKPSAMAANNDMRPEYDFTSGVRGKHYKAMQEGYIVKIHKPDGTTVVKQFSKLSDGMIMLQPDVREYFPDSASVNSALRSLITLMSQLPGKSRFPDKKTRHMTRKKTRSGRER